MSIEEVKSKIEDLERQIKEADSLEEKFALGDMIQDLKIEYGLGGCTNDGEGTCLMCGS